MLPVFTRDRYDHTLPLEPGLSGGFLFTVDLSEWNRIHQEEFAGKSHEKITMEVYKK
ncbi:MAG: hypothetical protein ACLTX3_08990 [Lachnospiraceae bacterium]